MSSYGAWVMSSSDLTPSALCRPRHPDIVYIIKPSDYNPELRYSLRSVETNLLQQRPPTQLPRVFTVGHQPPWVSSDHVTHIPVEQSLDPNDKHPNANKNLHRALTDPDISDPFWLFNDDFFIMRPTTAIQQYTGGLVRDVLDKFPRAVLGSTFRRSMQWTYQMVQRHLNLNPDRYVSFQVHSPLLIYKEPYLDVIQDVSSWLKAEHTELTPLIGRVHPHYATVYGNIFGHLPGLVDSITIEHDVKVLSNSRRLAPIMRQLPYLSTTEHSFRHGAGTYIKRVFPRRSRFENEPLTSISRSHVGHGRRVPIHSHG